MRTPLTSIIGASELMIVGGLPAVKMEYLHMIKQSGETLLNIVNDLLDISSFDRGRFKLHRVVFNLHDLLMQIVQVHRRNISPGVEFISRIKIDEQLEVHGDIHRLTQILHKLLSNANKFTKDGEVTFIVELGQAAGNQIDIEFEIQDTGIGVSDEVQRNLFKPFFQADRTLTRQFGGVGLGLAICQELIHSMGGTITFRSKLSIGTTVQFNVLLETSARRPSISEHDEVSSVSLREDFPTTWYDTHSAPRSPLLGQRESLPTSSPSPTSRASILVVEDNLFNQQLIKRILSQTSNDVDTADNGDEALIKSERKSYDLIFMDIQMPIRDGIEATKLIRKNDPSVQIVGLTANCDEQSRKRAIQAGMNQLLFKPVRFDDLQQIVNKTIRRKSI
jgi:CheY-like chemotaxis protein